MNNADKSAQAAGQHLGTVESRDAEKFRPRNHVWAVVALFVLAAIADIVAIHERPLVRVQEARVLETAREMIDAGWRGWLIPHLNGEVRLQKPPLSYWMATASFEAFGVSAAAGRIHVLLLRWGTALIICWLGMRLFSVRGGVIAAGVLLGLYFFDRYGSFAETDIAATFFVTAGIAAIWECRMALGSRAVPGPGIQRMPTMGTPIARHRDWGPLPGSRTSGPALPSSRRFFWMAHLSAVAIALAILSKGPPAVFVVLFLVGFSIVARHPGMMARWVLTGAPVTIAVLALPWFIFIGTTPEAGTIAEEIDEVVSGTRHPEPFWFYFAQLFGAVAPWTPFFVFALVDAVPRWRESLPIRGILIWCLATLLPLFLISQKQEHYLLPMMPAAALLIGGFIDNVLRRNEAAPLRIARAILLCILAAGAIAALLIPVLPLSVPDPFTSIDAFSLAIIIAAAMLVLACALRHGWAGAFVGSAPGIAVVMITMLGIWSEQFRRPTSDEIAAAISSRFPESRVAFYRELDVPLLFSLRRAEPVPILRNAGEVRTAFASIDGLGIIAEFDDDEAVPPPLAELTIALQFARDDKRLLVLTSESFAGSE